MAVGPVPGHATAALVRCSTAPETVVASPGRLPVTLLLVAEWRDQLGVRLSWPECGAEAHRDLREAYHLTDAGGRTCPLVASTVQPLAGRLDEVTFFDTSGAVGPRTLALRLRSRLADPVPIAFRGRSAPRRRPGRRCEDRSPRRWR